MELKNGFTLNEEKDPEIRKRHLECRRAQIWEQVIILLDQADILSHELQILKKGGV